MTDIDRAIAATDPDAPTPIQLVITVGNPPRPVIMIVPSNLSGDELMEWIAWMAAAAGFRSNLTRVLQGDSGLVVARTLPTE